MKWPRTPHTQHNAPSRHTSEQQPRGRRQRTRNTTGRASTPENGSQVAQDTAHMQRKAPSGHTGEQEPSGPGHRTRNTTRRASTPVNRSHVAQETAHATQRTERAHRCTGAKWPRTPHTQGSTPSEHTGEQEPSGSGHRTRRTAHEAGRPVNRNQVAQDTAHTTQRAERAHW